MEVKVKLSNLRVAPKKARKVVDLVRGKRATEAQAMLTFTINRSAQSVLKLLNSAIATAKNDFNLNEANLFVSKITVDEGPKLKRWHPMSRGRAYPIIKRSSHIALVLGELHGAEKTEKPVKKVEKIQEKPEVKAVKKQVRTKKTTTKKNKK